MLVLTRKVGEVVVICDGLIRVTVLENQQGQVKLGFDAPAGLPINRLEIQERIDRQREEETREGNQLRERGAAPAASEG